MKKSEIFNRRQQVWHLHTQGYSQDKIAQKQGVSLRTVSMDLEYLKKEAIEWCDSLPAGQLQVYCKSNFDTIEKVKYELWNLYETTNSEKTKIKILSAVATLAKSSSEMVPTNFVIKELEWLHKSIGGKTVSASVREFWRISERISNLVKKDEKDQEENYDDDENLDDENEEVENVDE